jgi:hypothetical protein
MPILLATTEKITFDRQDWRKQGHTHLLPGIPTISFSDDGRTSGKIESCGQKVRWLT